MGTDRSIQSGNSGKWPRHESENRELTRAEYAKEFLRVQLWDKFESAYALIDRGAARFLIRSCNGAGKSFFLASIINTELVKNDNVQVICTGASYTQLKNTLWASTKKLAHRTGLDMSEFRAFEWAATANKRAIALSPGKIESGQGFHAERVVVIIDEATSMPQEKITALMSNATGENALIIFTYNPINPSSAVFDLEQNSVPVEQFQNKNDWVSIGISAFDHPNVIRGEEIIKGAITRNYVETMLRVDSTPCDKFEPGAIHVPWAKPPLDWYHPTPEAYARVCGGWSEAISVGFISGSVVVASWKVEATSGPRVAGADIGGGGDDPSVWTHFRGNQQMEFESLKTGELGVVASRIHNYCIENEIDAIGVDDTGVGHGVTDRLQERKPKYKVIPVHFGQAPKNFPETAVRQPANARAEMYFLLEKEMRSERIKILYDKELQRELCSMKIRSLKELVALEDKSLIKKRIGRSPNKADATALARYAGRLLQYQNRPFIY